VALHFDRDEDQDEKAPDAAAAAMMLSVIKV
jgi:hypothetical protein